MVGGTILAMKLSWNSNKGGKVGVFDNNAYEKANALLSDMIINYKTVASFGEENIDLVFGKFEQLMLEPMNRRIRNAHIAGLCHGYSQCARMIFMGIVFYIGSFMISKLDFPVKDVYMCINVLMHGAMGIGMSLSNFPSVARSKASAQNIFSIIDEESTLDVRDGKKAPIQNVQSGGIKFIDVDFKYPSRKHQKVLNKFNMEIKPTQKIALVGASGCGKSTITNLLLRFYNLEAGRVEIDGAPIEDYNIENLRRQIGYVMQEPVLFNQNIKDNILFGQPDASDKEIRKVCELANALSFIETDIEDKDKEKYQAYVKEQLADKMSQIGSAELQSYIKTADDFSLEDVLFTTLEKADGKALAAITKHVDVFIELLKEVKESKGVKWDDMCVKHEWNVEMSQIDYKANPAGKDEVERALKDYKYQFSKSTVEQWLASPTDSLVSLIEANRAAHTHKVYLRYDELLDNLMERDADKPLHAGFTEKKCGLKGAMLSGGQKQRIAIARALIKRPKILILDEATSALDEKSQEIVQQALDRAMEGRTSIVIAHRLSTIRNCELLFVIKDGVICE